MNHVIKKDKLDIAEDIVYGWYSVTRDKHIEDKGVIVALQTRIIYRLISQGVDPKIAKDLSVRAIDEWARFAEGRECSDLRVMESLVEAVSKVVR